MGAMVVVKLLATPFIFRRLQHLFSAQRADIVVIRTSLNKTSLTE
jgi:hypothetical protein